MKGFCAVVHAKYCAAVTTCGGILSVVLVPPIDIPPSVSSGLTWAARKASRAEASAAFCH